MIEPGSTSQFSYTVPLERTVRHVLPESPEFQSVPDVFATAYMVGLLEWACMRHLDETGHVQEGQISVGTDIRVDHSAATLPGQTVTVDVVCTAVEGRMVSWDVTARDERDVITKGTHQRAVLDKERFLSGLAKKAEEVGVDPIQA